MFRTAATRRVRTAAALATSGVLAAATVYGLTQYADAADALPRPVAGGAVSADMAPAAGTAESALAPSTAPVKATAETKAETKTKTATATATKTKTATATKTATKAEAATKTVGGAPKSAGQTDLLDPALLPDNAHLKWKRMAPAGAPQEVGTFGFNECATVAGPAAWAQQGFISANRTPAAYDSLSFADEAAAKAAYQQVLDGMEACAATSRSLQQENGLTPDAEVRRTAAADNGRAWSRRWNAVGGSSAPGPQTNHFYVVQRGTVLTFLSFVEWDASATPSYDVAEDAAVLARISG
ncbi:hypothetical protein ACFYP6_13970 [Streptomyces goshikiensis]|uniref:hypothetical protein n=1 Tax=Streptomyces goshikiensis TaxID=1942 RepID=UPI003695719B